MATNKAIRADDVSGLNIATVSFSEDAVTKHAQQVTLVDSATPTQKLAIDASGNVAVKAAANSGVDIGDVTVNNAAGASAVNIQDGGNSITVDGTFFQATQPVSAASLPLPTGAATAAKQPALGTAGTASADVITVQGIASMTALKTDGSGVTQPVSATSLPLPTGASTAAKQPALGTAGTAATDVITIQGIASMTAVKVDGSAVTQPVSFGLATSGGYTTKHLVSAGSTNATSIKASAGQVYGWSIYSAAAYPVYVKFHNTAGAPTPGTGVVQTIGIQAGTGVNIFNTAGIPFSTGIGLSVVKGIADADATAVLASDCVVDIFYA